MPSPARKKSSSEDERQGDLAHLLHAHENPPQTHGLDHEHHRKDQDERLRAAPRRQDGEEAKQCEKGDASKEGPKRDDTTRQHRQIYVASGLPSRPKL